MPQVDLHYSETLLGHFTLIIYDRVDLIAFRVHFVDRDAEASAGAGKLAWAQHKLAQITGFAKGRVLMDWQASPFDFSRRVEYIGTGRRKLRGWPLSVAEMDAMLDWVQTQVSAQQRAEYLNYGYVVYSNNVDSCGSWALKCLAAGGINVQLPILKSWIPLPSLIHKNI